MASHDENLRKALHAGAGAGAFLLRWLGTWGGLALAAAAVLFNAVLLDRVTAGRVVRPREREPGRVRATVVYPVAAFLLIACLPGRLEIAAAAWGILAFGDAAAGAVGRWLGGPPIPWNRRKHWSGLVAFVLLSVPVAAFLVRWTQGAGATGVGTAFGGVHGSRAWLLVASAAAAGAAAVAESLDSTIDDNVLVPLAAALALLALAAVEPARLAGAWAVAAGRAPAAGLLALAALGALGARAVSRSGALGGWVLASALLMFAGWPAVLVFAAFVAVGTGATRLGYRRKRALGLAQERGGRRDFAHALANGGAGTVFAFLFACGQPTGVWALATVAAFASAAFDTAASEVGQAVGRRHVLPTTLRRVAAGTYGAISPEGTLGGVLAAAVVVATALATGWLGWTDATCALLGAGGGAMAESVVGALMKRQRPVDNHLLNLGATLAGAAIAVALATLRR